MYGVSVVICTHNPNPDYLSRALQGLKKQTLQYAAWELIIVDNASEKHVEDQFDISWHPNGRFVCEKKLGLIHARLKGISEASGKLLVFFDDDNVPNPDYLEKAKEIADNFPFIGVFGGSQTGEFEMDPPKHLRKYLGMLAVREIDCDKWSNLYLWETTPAGAGMIIRSEVAEKFVKNVRSNQNRAFLGRSGTSLMSGEDNDMAFTALDMGYGMGLFNALDLVHIIPKSRITEAYLLNLAMYISASKILLKYIRGQDIKKHPVLEIRQLYFEFVKLLSLKTRSLKPLIFELKRMRKIYKGYKMAASLIYNDQSINNVL